jgi:hypothetical protein
MNSLVAWAKRPIRVTLATVSFCFVEGAVLALPAAILLVPIKPFAVPERISEIVVYITLAALCGVPAWCLLCWRKHRRLARLRLVTLLLVVAVGCLFPALQ